MEKDTKAINANTIVNTLDIWEEIKQIIIWRRVFYWELNHS